jgi:hypothetical protein
MVRSGFWGILYKMPVKLSDIYEEVSEMPQIENVTETKPTLASECSLPGQAVDAGAG